MTSLRERYGLRQVVNAWGTATRYGVSRSPAAVVAAVSEALENYVDMEEAAAIAGREIARFLGAEWGCITHCTAASITLAAAACMTGNDREKVARLPDVTGMAHKILLQSGQCIHYGAPIEQALRLSGARVAVVGAGARTRSADLAAALAGGDVAALLLVESHLAARQGPLPLEQAVAAAHRHGVPVILDAAAQDRRAAEIMATGADLVLFSAQKYLCGPTAGIVAGRRDLVEAVALQQSGIGRAMKPTKEAIFGTLAALACRAEEDGAAWARHHQARLENFRQRLAALPGIQLAIVPDPNGNPFARLRLSPIPGACALDAAQLAAALAAGDPIIATGAHYARDGYLNLEILDLDDAELDQLYRALAKLLAR